MLRKYFLAIALMFCFCGWGIAEEASTPEQLAREIAPLVSESTVCVVYIDFTKMEPRQFIESYLGVRQILKDTIPEESPFWRMPILHNPIMPITATVDVESFTKQVETILEKNVKENGINHVYHVVMLGNNDLLSTCLAIPQSDGLNEKALDYFVEKNGFKLFPMGDRITQSARQEYIDQMFGKGFVAMERPEVAQGFALAKDAPVKAVAMWPSYMKMLVTETMPQMPEPFETISSETLLDGTRFVAVGFNPNNLHCEFVIQSNDQAAAEQLHQLVTTFSTQYEKQLLKFSTFGVGAHLLASVVAKNQNVLFPAPQDGKITINFRGVDSAGDLQKVVNDISLMLKSKPVNAEVSHHQCMNNMKMITLAMHNYYDVHKCFPPVNTVDKEGKPLHSWRVLLLPYLEQSALYESIKLDEPWDSEHNKQFHDKCTKIYQCPYLTDEEKKAGMTSYSFVVGNDTYPIPGKRNFTFDGITDGTSNTIAVIERKTPINWMCPTGEITQEQAFLGLKDPESGIGLRHRDGTALNVPFFDASVHLIDDTIDLKKWRALLTRNGGETINW